MRCGTELWRSTRRGAGPAIAAQSIPFAVRDGTDTTVEVTPVPGVARRFEFALQAGTQGYEWVRARFESEGGVVDERWFTCGADRPAEVELAFSPGRHTVTAVTDGGRSGRVEFGVPGDDPDARSAIRVTLR